MPPPSHTPAGTKGSILLVEEYQALAVAFSSVLKKFASSHQTRVVGSLSEAEALLTDLKPELLVLDCDPPPLGSVKFFNRLRSTLPEARVLIVAAENSEDFDGEPNGPDALHFIKKPFEVEKFGATIQTLLAPAAVKPGRGTVGDLKLADMILFYAITAVTIILKVDAARGRSGEIHFALGQIAHAAAMGKSGVEALAAMLQWPSPRFGEAERPIDSPHTIHGAWAPIVREALRAAKSPAAAVHEEDLETPVPVRGGGKKIVVVDDTELLLIFVEEILVTANPELEIVTALSGSDGLKAAAAVRPDLLLLDYSLPDLDGGAVCKQLLEDEATARIPVIMMSGHVPEMTAAAERYENVVATIAKPFLSSVLLDLVGRILTDLPHLQVGPKKGKTSAGTTY